MVKQANVMEVVELLDCDTGGDDLVLKLVKPNSKKSEFFVEIEIFKTGKRELAYSCDTLQKAKELFAVKLADILAMGYTPAPMHATA